MGFWGYETVEDRFLSEWVDNVLRLKILDFVDHILLFWYLIFDFLYLYN